MALWRRFGGAQPPTDSPRKTPQSRYGHAKTHFAAPPTPFSAFPRPFVLRRERHKEAAKPEVDPERQITAPTSRERTHGDLDPAEQERKIPQAVLFGARRQTAGVIERKTPQ